MLTGAFLCCILTLAPQRRLNRTKHLSGGNRYEHYSRKAR